ncbi:hydroxypyruvate isomerase family protein [Haloprofundus salinisoli]|uniref:hydroxypyruvate isomerase family protein n=1 Tax=Haloprofundus salinisoli TaxID=2876193 RepID=UPI001CCC779F|nr:TIM barrel protein [Haloprofundus salinisoli]
MVDFSVCIEMVYDDDPFHDRIGRAADAGAGAIEFWDWREKDLGALRAAADDADILIAGCTAGGVLTDLGATDETVETIRESIATASELDCPTLIVTTGPDQDGASRETQHENIVEILGRVAKEAEDADVTLVVEPLNTAVDHPGYYLTDTAEGVDIVREVDSPSVKLLYDVYHQQVTEGNVIETITENIDHIGHIHIADVPGRHEPGTGEINYENLLAAIDDAGYDGYVGCEFTPTVDPDKALAATFELD